MKRTALVGMLALASWSAQAAHDGPGWRVGAAASFSDFDWSDGEIIEDTSVGAKIYAQYQFNSWLGIEGAYHNTGDFSEDVVTGTSAFPPGAYELRFSGFSGAALGYIPLPTDEIRFYGKVGYYDFDDELSFNGTVTSNGSESGVMAGAGAMIEIAENFGLRVDLDWFDAEVGDLWSANLGLEYFFGGSGGKSGASAAAPPPAPTPPAVEEESAAADEAAESEAATE